MITDSEVLQRGQSKDRPSLVCIRERKMLSYLCFFSAWESWYRAEKWWSRVVKRLARKASGYFNLELHFHADARVRSWPSDSDWLIFLQTPKSTLLVRLIGNTKGTVELSATALLVAKKGKNLFAKYFSSQFMHVRDCFEGIWPRCSRRNFQRFKVEPNFNWSTAIYTEIFKSLLSTHSIPGTNLNYVCIFNHHIWLLAILWCKWVLQRPRWTPSMFFSFWFPRRRIQLHW